ncbi:hypothetical protein [Microbacterium azadirachtae]|uniref:hypothetical protein n=1 Tax=Microbacterium azadirachtae TaxID=582680 RepID=UPI00126A74FE|nr:hypothetical protein [Microbacterium azadirachtae]
MDRIEDRIRQHRQVESGPILVVEGPDDLLLLRDHVPQEIIFPADGKRNVLRAMDSLAKWNLVGIRAIVDADFDEPEGGRDDPRVLLYEGRDLEGMLILFGVLIHLLEHQGSVSKLDGAGGPQKIVGQLVQEAHIIAEIRAANERESWGLPFDKVDITGKADRRTLRLDLSRYVAALIQASDSEVKASVVLEVVVGDQLDGRGPRGRDVLAFAGLALRAQAGSLPAAATGVDVLGGQLRSSAGLAIAHSEWLSVVRESINAAEAEVR